MRVTFDKGAFIPVDAEAGALIASDPQGQEFELVPVKRTRTRAQNRSLHQWLRDCAATLNAAGADMKKTLRHDADIPWTEHSFKEYVWRPVQEAMTGEHSSTRPSPGDYPAISETIMRYIAGRVGVTLPPWPCDDTKAV